MVNTGRPCEIATSTSTGWPSIPTTATLSAFAITLEGVLEMRDEEAAAIARDVDDVEADRARPGMPLG